MDQTIEKMKSLHISIGYMLTMFMHSCKESMISDLGTLQQIKIKVVLKIPLQIIKKTKPLTSQPLLNKDVVPKYKVCDPTPPAVQKAVEVLPHKKTNPEK